ncbi:lysoplasmalogenase [Streptomyces armeniacus]|uniref:Lysoplasmalogenase n=1 Tax=Streptomyces armeniacus TaxID=83291 RepID=A0A345Y142_9ACTN|nr:lysoplasmalogenase family protein [Streptomyces armeniacus]AXK37608.1 lysoplasmalogenase [Streptomyces armeniacus]
MAMAITGRGARSLLRSAACGLVRPDGHGRGALAAYGALSAVDLLATARAPRGPRRAAKPLLMPALAAHVLRRRASSSAPLPKRLTAGLAFAAAGDTALLFDDHEPAFLLGMAAFLGTQVCYAAGLAGLPGTANERRTSGARRGARTRGGAALGCLAAWAAANAALAPTLDPQLRLPVAGYSLALAAMGAAAFGVGGRVAAGAGAFLASDLLIGLQAAGHEMPSQEVLIMAGYMLGQYLLVTGWLDILEGSPATPAGTP